MKNTFKKSGRLLNRGKYSLKSALAAMAILTGAGAVQAGSGGPVLIKEITIEVGKGALITTMSPIGDQGCIDSVNAGRSMQQVVITANDPLFQARYSMALAAFLAGKKVSFYFIGCQATNWGYETPIISLIAISNTP